MISRTGRLAYAHGHLGARLGARPGSADWARLQAIGDVRSYIEAARRTRIAGLLGGITAGESIHDVEAGLRARWREEVSQVAHWYARADRPSVEWLSHVAILPAIAHLAEFGAAGDAAMAWMRAEPALAPFVAAADGEAVTDDGLAAFAAAFTGAKPAYRCWFEHWRALWPAVERSGLEALAARIAALSGGLEGSAAVLPAPEALDPVFEKALRKRPRSVVAGIAYLGLVAGDLRRLRGQIVVRQALPALQGAAA